MVRVIKSINTSKPDIAQEGIHSATLTNVKEFSNAYGQRIGFEFTLENNSILMRSTNVLLSEKSNLADVIRGLKGRTLNPNEFEDGIDLHNLIGTKCQVFVSNSSSKNGIMYSKVEKIFNPT